MASRWQVGALALVVAIACGDGEAAPRRRQATSVAPAPSVPAPSPVPEPSPSTPPALPEPPVAPAPAPGPAPVAVETPAAPGSLEAVLDEVFPAPAAAGTPEEEPPAPEVIARTDRGRLSYVLASGATGVDASSPPGSRIGPPPVTYTFELLKLQRTTDPNGAETFSVLASLTVAEDVLSPEENESDCETATELRARDVDRDGETELTAIVAGVLLDYDHEHTERECVVRAVIVGADDLRVAFIVERERRSMRTDAWTESESRVTRTWRFADSNQDGHPDLEVVQTTDARDFEAADGCDPDEDPTPEHRHRQHGRLAWTCLYDPSRDLWACPPDAILEEPARPAPGSP